MYNKPSLHQLRDRDTPKKIVPLAEALLSSLLYIFPASYRLPWCTPSPTCGPHFLLQDYLHYRLILSSGTLCRSIKLYGAVVICVSPEAHSKCLTIHICVFSHLSSSILISSLTVTLYYFLYLYSK